MELEAPPEPKTVDFASWYDELAPRLSRSLTILTGDVEVARDLTAEACARAWELWPRLTGEGSTPDGWTYRVGFNLARRRWRLARRHATTDQNITRERAIGATQPELDLRAAISQLPRRQRQAIVLRYFADLPEREIAEVLGISVGAASATLTNARKRLRERLGEGFRDA